MAQVQVSQQTNIDKYLGKLNKFEFNTTRNDGIPKFKSSNAKGIEIQGLINTAIQPLEAEKAKIETIRETLNNNDKSSFVKSNTKNQYNKYLTYLENLIDAKITKDKSIMGLLALSFNGINTSINTIEEIREQFTGKELNELIPLNDVNEYTLELDKNTANALGKEYNQGDKLTIENINTAISKMIETCTTNIQKYITEFQEKLTQTEQTEQADIITGGDYKNLGDGKNNVSITNINNYKTKLKDIKEKYEKALKDDIKDYKKLCDLLTETDGGLLNNINKSVQILRRNSNKLSKKMGLKLDTLLDSDPFAENKNLFDNLIRMVEEEKEGLSLNTNIPNPQGIQGNQVKILTKVGETKKKGSQPITEGFQKFLDNLKLEDENDNNEILELYRVSLLTSLKNIKTALDESMAKDGSARTKTSSPNSYIAYAFGWNDPIGDPNNPNTYKSGEWRETEIINDGSPPTGTIELRIKLLEQRTPDNDKIDKKSLINITNDMIKLLQHEKSSAEKGSSQGTNYQEFKETQESFIPQLPSGASSSTPTGGGYKKKSKSKKMTSKKTSMKVAKKTSSKAKENKNKNKKIVKSYSKSKSKKQSGGFIRGGVLFPQDFYDTSTVM